MHTYITPLAITRFLLFLHSFHFCKWEYFKSLVPVYSDIFLYICN